MTPVPFPAESLLRACVFGILASAIYLAHPFAFLVSGHVLLDWYRSMPLHLLGTCSMYVLLFKRGKCIECF